MTAAAPPGPSAMNVDRWFPVALVVAAAAVRLPWLGAADLWTDEIHTLQALGGGVGETVRERLAAGHLPVYFLLMKAWAAVGGTESQFLLRVPSALLGVACTIPALVLFRRLLEPVAARWAAALLVLHPLWVELSREARMYPFLCLAALVALEGAVAARQIGRTPLRFWAAVLVGPLVHPTWGLLLVAVAVWALLLRRRGVRLPRAVLVGLAASAALVVAGLLLATAQHQELARRPWPREVGVFILRQFCGSGIRSALLVLHVAVAAAWLSVVVEGTRSAPRIARGLALVLLVVLPLGSVAAGLVAGVPWGPVRYVAAGTIGLALLAGAGAARSGPVYRWALVLAVAATLGVRFAEPDTNWSDAARVIGAGARPDAPVVAPDVSTAIVLSYYLNRGVHPAGGLPAETDGYWCAGAGETPHWVTTGAGAHAPDDR